MPILLVTQTKILIFMFAQFDRVYERVMDLDVCVLYKNRKLAINDYQVN